MLNIVLILQGEIISWSLMGGEGLNKLQQCMEDYFSVTDYENLQGITAEELILTQHYELNNVILLLTLRIKKNRKVRVDEGIDIWRFEKKLEH